MTNTIYSQPNLLLESYCALAQLANPDAPFNVRKSFASSTNLIPEKERLMKKMLDYFDRLESNLSIPQDRLEYFFKITDTEDTYESKGALLFNACLEAEHIDTLLVDVKNFNQAERFTHLRALFAKAMASTPEAIPPLTSAIVDEPTLFHSIFDADTLSDAQKYELLYMYYHYETLLGTFIDLIKQVTTLITPLLLTFQEEVDALINHISPELEAKGMNYFNQQFNIDLGDGTPYTFYPCISAPLTMTFTNNYASLDTFNIFFGIYVLPVMVLNKESGATDKELARFLKVLADPTKFQITKLLRTERLYASQLAQKLDITNATISHHMNVLIELGIVKCEREQNKFYYFTQEDKLKHYLTYLNQSLNL